MSAESKPPVLFTPIKVGTSLLKHRVAFAPCTRFRADIDHVPTDLMVEYYSQRASTPGTLLITEATPILAKAGGYDHAPGIYTDAQIKGWKKVLILWHLQTQLLICYFTPVGSRCHSCPWIVRLPSALGFRTSGKLGSSCKRGCEGWSSGRRLPRCVCVGYSDAKEPIR